MPRKAALLMITFAPLFFCAGLHAQITGGLRGTVSDPTGAAVPKANVTLTNVATKQARTQPVNERGEFTFELLTPGDYEVKAESAGDRKSTRLNFSHLAIS